MTKAGEKQAGEMKDETLKFFESEYGWHYTADEEMYYGGFDTKEQAIKEADYDFGQPYFVAKCWMKPTRLSEYFDLDEWLENLVEGSLWDFLNPCGDYEFNFGSAEQIKEIETAIKSALDEWQIRHNLKVWPNTFDKITDFQRVEADQITRDSPPDTQTK